MKKEENLIYIIIAVVVAFFLFRKKDDDDSDTVPPPIVYDAPPPPPVPVPVPVPVLPQTKYYYEEQVEKLKLAMDGWGTDEDAVYSVLEFHNCAELAEIYRLYGVVDGMNLFKVLKSEFSGSELVRALKPFKKCNMVTT